MPSRDHAREERQYRHPNFRSASGQLYLVRCFACSASIEHGTENHAAMAAAGTCAWCGWQDGNPIYPNADPDKEGSL
jgi:hypothetical protein